MSWFSDIFTRPAAVAAPVVTPPPASSPVAPSPATVDIEEVTRVSQEVAQRVASDATRAAMAPVTEQLLQMTQQITLERREMAAPLQNAYAMNEPRRFRDYQDPRSRPFRSVTVDTMRILAQTYDVLGSCIAHLKDQVIKTPVHFVPKDDNDKSAVTAKQMQAAKEFFESEGGLGSEGDTRADFEGKWLDDLLVIGCSALFLDFETVGSRTDGEPDSITAIDASTIRPLVTPFGFAPSGDAVVYEQVVQGMRVASFRRDELIYKGLPIFAQTHSPYYLSAVELLALVVLTALKSDEWNRTWLTDGNMPDTMIATPKEWTPPQIQEYAEYFDLMLSGDSRGRHKAKFVPEGFGSAGQQTRKDADFQAFDNWLRDRACSLCGVSPASIGHAGDTYQHSQEGAQQTTRENRVAQILLFRSQLYTDICRRKGWGKIQATDNEPQSEDAALRATRHQTEIGSGQRTINECRQEDGIEPSTEPGASILVVQSTLTPLSKLLEAPPDAGGGDASAPSGDPVKSPTGDAPPAGDQPGVDPDQGDDQTARLQRVVDDAGHSHGDDGKFDGGQGTSSAPHDALTAECVDHVHKLFDTGNPNLTPERAAEYKASAETVIARMSPKTQTRLISKLKVIHSENTLQALSVRRHLKPGVLGCWAFADKSCSLDGGVTPEETSSGKNRVGIYAHEFGHAVDNCAVSSTGEHLNGYSMEPAWQEAFKAEIKPADGSKPLSRYARTNAAEGFAEFARLLWTKDLTPDEVQAKFPKCYAFWQNRGLL